MFLNTALFEIAKIIVLGGSGVNWCRITGEA